MSVGKRIAVIGAGPIGLAAALGAVRRGHDVTVYEAGDVGSSLAGWGDTTFFTPLSMNVPPASIEILGPGLPPLDTCLTGPAFVDAVLRPLAMSAPLAGKVLVHHRVRAVGRTGMSRGDFPGHPVRGERAFRLLVEAPDADVWREADAVLDASGVFSKPLPAGIGGLPALGEEKLGTRILRHLGAVHRAAEGLGDATILLVGHGHSAAHALRVLARVFRDHDEPRVVWAVRSAGQRPCVEVASDPLPERRDIVAAANDLAQRPPPWLRIERRAQVLSFTPREGRCEVVLTGDRRVTVDFVISLTGYAPDHALSSELALAIGPVTEGSARLERALANVTDCLSVPKLTDADLASGEPGFHLLGAKSYGRSRTFLLQTGYGQVDAVLGRLEKKDSLLDWIACALQRRGLR